MAVQYINIDYRMQDCASIEAQIALIDGIITSLFQVALISVGNGDTVQYSLDTGQTKIQKTYSNPKAVTDALWEYRRLRQALVNSLQPRNVRLVDSKNFGRR